MVTGKTGKRDILDVNERNVKVCVFRKGVAFFGGRMDGKEAVCFRVGSVRVVSEGCKQLIIYS